MCNKIKYSKDTAIRVLDEARKARLRGEMWREEIRYYWCEECEAYHVTGKMWKHAESQTRSSKVG